MSHPVALHVHVWNPDGERSALLLHGLGSDGRTMWRLAEVLAERGLRVVAPDLRNHGLSPTAASCALAGYAADVARLGDGWHLAVGHSLGGSILTRLLGREGFARRAVLIDPLIRLEPEAEEELRAGLRWEVGGGLTVEALTAAQPTWDDEDVHRKVLAAALVSPRTTDLTLDENLPWDLTDLVVDWRCAVHVLAADPTVGALVSPSLAAALAGHDHVTVTTVSGAGHSIHRDAPAAVIDAVLAGL